MRERRSESRLVGRSRELARIRELAEDPTVGAVLVTGAIGVGKSRLSEGALVDLTGRGWRGVGLSATDPGSRIRYGALSELIPDTLDGLDRLDPDTAELSVLRAVETALELERPEPVAVVLDEVATIDAPACDLLVHLATNRRLFIVANQGPEQELDEALRRLTPAGVVEVAIDPLGRSATAELAADVLGGPIGPGLIRNLHERTQGSPLFVRELLASARANGRVRSVDGVFQLAGDLALDPSLGRQIVFRFGLLSQAEQDVLELLALAGELGADDLAAVAGPEVLETMERRGLIDTVPSGRRLRIRHGHPLHGEAVAVGMTPLIRRRRHRELVGLIEGTEQRRADDRVTGAVTRLAAGREVTVDERLEAVTLALRIDRVREGAELAHSAHAEEPSERTTEVLAEVLIRQGRFVEADRLLAEPLGDNADEWARLRRAIRRSSNRVWGFRDTEGALQIDDRCLATLTERAAIDRVMAHQGWVDYCDGRPTDALDRLDALRSPDDEDVPDVRYAIVTALAPTLVLVGRVDEAADLAQRAWDEEWGGDTPYGSRGQHLIALGFAKLYQGDVEAARFVAATAIDHCRISNEITGLLFFLDLAANVEMLVGDFPAAMAFLEEALQIGGDLAIGTSVRSSLAAMAIAEAQVGRHAEARSFGEQLQRVPEAPGPRWEAETRTAEAWIRASAGDGPGAAAILRGLADGTAHRGLAIHHLLALFDLARLGYATEVEAAAAAAAAATAQGALAPALARAVAACTAGDGAALDQAAAELGHLGFRLWAAELSARAADSWAAVGEQRAATVSQRSSDRTRAELPPVRTPGLARTQVVDPLTRREREIAVIAASGVTNNGIAERLHLSVRTVETHLHRIYRKLGVGGRAELATALDVDDGADPDA